MSVRDQLTTATGELMRRNGVAGTGIAEILRLSGVARRTIYLNFPGGKSELVAATTRTIGDAMTGLLRECARRPAPLRAFAEIWAPTLIALNYEGGCPIVAAVQGRSEAPAAADEAAAVIREWGELLVAGLRESGVDPEVTESLATTVIAAVEGAVILCQAEQSTEPLTRVTAHLEELVALHTEHSPR